MPLYIFSVVTTYNKFFYDSFVFLQDEDKDSYYYVVSQILELYTYIR